MKMLIDQNLPPRLVKSLVSRYPGTCHVLEIGLDTADDGVIWETAKQDGFVILSKDSDFQHRALVYGAPPQVVMLSVGNCSSQKVIDLVTSRLDQIEWFGNDPSASLLVLE